MINSTLKMFDLWIFPLASELMVNWEKVRIQIYIEKLKINKLSYIWSLVEQSRGSKIIFYYWKFKISKWATYSIKKIWSKEIKLKNINFNYCFNLALRIYKYLNSMNIVAVRFSELFTNLFPHLFIFSELT